MWWKSIGLCIFQITLVSRRAFSDREDDSVSPDLIKYVAVIKEESQIAHKGAIDSNAEGPYQNG